MFFEIVIIFQFNAFIGLSVWIYLYKDNLTATPEIWLLYKNIQFIFAGLFYLPFPNFSNRRKHTLPPPMLKGIINLRSPIVVSIYYALGIIYKNLLLIRHSLIFLSNT